MAATVGKEIELCQLDTQMSAKSWERQRRAPWGQVRRWVGAARRGDSGDQQAHWRAETIEQRGSTAVAAALEASRG